METYYGQVRTPADAIMLFEACRLGLLPRVQRRLSEKERQSIRSGSVFVWDEREAGMRRWTDGKSWSASRVSGSFLTYREMEGKRGHATAAFSAPVAAARSRAGKTPDSTRGSDSDVDMPDDGPDGYRYKPDGLVKQSFSITTSTGQHLHLISYCARTHPSTSSLMQPSNDPALRHVRPQKGMYPESTVPDPPSLVPRSTMAGAPAYVTGGPPGSSGARLSPSSTHPRSYTAPTGYSYPTNGSSLHLPHHPPFGNGGGHHHPHHHQHHQHHAGMHGMYGVHMGQSITPTTSMGMGMPTIMGEAPPTLPLPLPHRRRRGSGSSSGSGLLEVNSQMYSGPPRPGYTPTSAPHVVSMTGEHQPPSLTSTPLLSKIDPRLLGLGGGGGGMMMMGNNGSYHHLPPTSASRTPPPQSTSNSPSGGPPPPMLMMTMSDRDGGNGYGNHYQQYHKNGGGGGGGGGIPGIGALMHGAGTLEHLDTASDHSISRGVSRAGSRSPAGSLNGGGGGLPTEIPSEKLTSFGEDQRALRVLNRAFSA
ncbi:MAG: asparaginyl-tRNA synthetase [Watsoniomyces obsoletus]|nr:MAG: asparaginyl-tRNA synthetase [Watsoniomyces obsoletus]